TYSLPMRLYEKAKRLGVWNPTDIDLERDRADWFELTDDQREAILQTTSLFVAGVEAVTVELLPLVLTIARERRLEEELYLTTFLWEEGKHTEFFRRWLDVVAGSPADGVRARTRLLAADPPLWEIVETRMNELLPLALGVVDEGFSRFGDESPFGLRKDDVAAFAASQFAARLERIRP